MDFLNFLPFILMLVLGILPLLFFSLTAFFQYRIARKWEHRNAWTAFIPLVSQYQLFQLTKRPFWHTFIPILNIVALIQMQARLCTMNGERAIFQVYLFIPFLNLWALHRLANNKRIYIQRDDRFKRIQSLVQAIEQHTPKDQIFAKAEQAFMEPKEIRWLYYLAQTIHRQRLKVIDQPYVTYIPEFLLILWLGGPFLIPLLVQGGAFLQLIPKILPALSQQLEEEAIQDAPFLICAQYQTIDNCNSDNRCNWGTNCPPGSGQCGLEVLPGLARCLPKISGKNEVFESDTKEVEKKSRPRPRAKSSEKPVVDTSDWKTYTNEEHQIEFKYPTTYKQQENILGASVVLYAPKQRNSEFADNINLMVQDISNQDLDLESYTDLSLNQIKDMVTDSRILEISPLQIAGYDAQQIIYTGRQGRFNLKWKQIYMVVNKKAYLFTYTARIESFQSGEDVLEAVIDSFQLQADTKKISPIHQNFTPNFLQELPNDPLYESHELVQFETAKGDQNDDTYLVILYDEKALLYKQVPYESDILTTPVDHVFEFIILTGFDQYEYDKPDLKEIRKVVRKNPFDPVYDPHMHKKYADTDVICIDEQYLKKVYPADDHDDFALERQCINLETEKVFMNIKTANATYY